MAHPDQNTKDHLRGRIPVRALAEAATYGSTHHSRLIKDAHKLKTTPILVIEEKDGKPQKTKLSNFDFLSMVSVDNLGDEPVLEYELTLKLAEMIANPSIYATLSMPHLREFARGRTPQFYNWLSKYRPKRNKDGSIKF